MNDQRPNYMVGQSALGGIAAPLPSAPQQLFNEGLEYSDYYMHQQNSMVRVNPQGMGAFARAPPYGYQPQPIHHSPSPIMQHQFQNMMMPNHLMMNPQQQ